MPVGGTTPSERVVANQVGQNPSLPVPASTPPPAGAGSGPAPTPATGGQTSTDMTLGHGPDGFGGDVEELRRKYPMWAPFLAIDEVRRVLEQAAAERWNPDTLRAEMMATHWYRTTDASRRQGIALRDSDPAEYEREIQVRVVDLQNRAQAAGITLNAEQIRTLAEGELLNGWTEAELSRSITDLIRTNEAAIGHGELAQFQQDVTQLGRDYHLSFDDAQIRDYALSLWDGSVTLDAVSSLARDTARQRYPWMADLLDQGFTVEQYFAPLKSEVARTLEVAADGIDLTDPSWMGLTETVDENGKRRPLTLTEGVAWARTHREAEWRDTRNYAGITQGFTDTLARTFGKIA